MTIKIFMQKNIYADFENDKKKNIQSYLKNILSKDIKVNMSKGICVLNAVLNKNQKRVIPKEFDIEHILPQKWEHYKYNGWSDALYRNHSKILGNLVPLERKLNIKASDRFFVEKQTYYAQSVISEVRDLGKLHDWTPSECNERQKNAVERLSNFFTEQ